MPVIILLMGFFVLASDQPVLMLAAMASYIAIGRLFWVDGEPKIIFLGLSLFWLSISIKLFYAIYAGVPYEKLSGASNIIETTYSALIAFVVFSLGLYFATSKVRKKSLIVFNNEYNYSSRRLFIVYGGSIVGLMLIKGSFSLMSGFDQLIFALIDIKLGFIFFLVYSIYIRKDNLPFATALIVIEIILSFFSFFSGFKDILFAVLVVLVTPRIKLTFKNLVAYFGISLVCLYMLFSWQMIKGEYRQFLNKGGKYQSMEVTQGEALDKLQELAGESRGEDERKQVLYSSIDRLSYIEFYSESRLKVPSFVPYENGKIWSGNIAHILLPRMFFPNKDIIDDSKMVNKYCFRKVLTSKSGVSFSLGFIAESYIDFGPVLMYIVIFLVGLFMGAIYSAILSKSINLFWGYTMVLPLFVKIACNGTPGSKILGWMITYFVTFLLFRKFLMEPIDKYLRTGKFKLNG